MFLLWRFSHCSNKLKPSVNFSRAFSKRKEKKRKNNCKIRHILREKKSHLSSYLDNEFLLIARTRQESKNIFIFFVWPLAKFGSHSSCGWFPVLSSHSEPAPSSGPWRMNGKWSENNFLLGFSFLANHGG